MKRYLIVIGEGPSLEWRESAHGVIVKHEEAQQAIEDAVAKTRMETQIDIEDLRYVLVDKIRSEERKRCIQACEEVKESISPTSIQLWGVRDCIAAIEALKDEE